MHFQDAQSGRERWAHSASDPSHLANGGDKIKAKAIVWMFANVPQTQHPTASYNSASQMQKAINKIWHITHQTVVQWRRMDKKRFDLCVRWMSLARFCAHAESILRTIRIKHDFYLPCLAQVRIQSYSEDLDRKCWSVAAVNFSQPWRFEVQSEKIWNTACDQDVPELTFFRAICKYAPYKPLPNKAVYNHLCNLWLHNVNIKKGY